MKEKADPNREKNIRALENTGNESLARLAARLCGTSVGALFSVKGDTRQVVSCFGTEHRTLERLQVLFDQTLSSDAPLVMADLRDISLTTGTEDEAGHLGFFAGIPLITPDGSRIGVLAVANHQPAILNEEQMDDLRALANEAVAQLVMQERQQQLQALAEERERASQEKLQHSENLLKMAGRMARLGGWAIELPFKELLWSEQIHEILEFPPGKVPTLEEILALYSPAHRIAAREALRRCAEDGTPFELDLEIHTAKGRLRQVRSTGQAMRDAEGNIIGIQGAFQDITEQKQSEQRLQQLAARLTNTLENITDAFFTLDREWRFTYLNREAEHVLQRSRNELLGKVVWAEFKEAVSSTFYREYHRAVQENTTVNFVEYYSPLGTWVEVRAYPGPEGLAVYFRDVSEQRRIQSAVMRVAAGVSAATGPRFFEQLALNMAGALGAHASFVARFLPDEPLTARTIAATVDGRVVANFDYQIEGTPCERFVHEYFCIVPDDVAALFPRSPSLASLGARGYVGQRLDSTSGKPLGLIFVLYRHPLKTSDFITSTLQIFAARATSELERLEADARIRSQASLLDKAKDAIIVRDLENRILFWNRGAEQLYGWSQEEAIGKAKVELLYHDPVTFARATEEVLQHGEWRGELAQRHKDGRELTVEAHWTLVRDEDNHPQAILSINTDITLRKAAELEIQRLAYYDQLTELPNRVMLLQRLQHALASSTRSQHHGALMFIDLDNFKMLNDTLGHDKGDMLLRKVARRLAGCVRESDTVARLGGDEFVVLLEDLHEQWRDAIVQATQVADKILTTLNQPYQLDGYEHTSTPSIGVALFQGHQDSMDDILKRADLAMYESKAAGRNAVRFFDPEMQKVVSARAQLESDLRQGTRAGEFQLYYQPQTNRMGKLTGVEALLRWNHPVRGQVSPEQFIPLAEETGLITVLGRWVLETACQQLVAWSQRPETRQLTVAVNVSPRQFRHPDFVAQVMDTLTETGANAANLKLELTESLLLEDVEDTVEKMMALRKAGVGFSLDDFGTGYSSLTYLKRLPLDQLKIDQSFVRHVLTDPSDAAIARTIVALGNSLHLSVVAEGVETVEQRDFLLRNGCHAFQGYFFSRPLALEQFELFIRRSASGRSSNFPS